MEVITLYYNVYENLFRDQDDNIFYDIFRVLTPGRLLYLKQVRGVEYVTKKEENVVYEIIFPYLDDDDQLWYIEDFTWRGDMYQ